MKFASAPLSSTKRRGGIKLRVPDAVRSRRSAIADWSATSADSGVKEGVREFLPATWSDLPRSRSSATTGRGDRRRARGGLVQRLVLARQRFEVLPRCWRFVPRATQAPNATIPRIGRADSRPQFADGTRQSPRRSTEAEILSQGMQPSMRGPDLETFRHHPSLGLGTDRSQSMRQMADLSHTPSTNCCQRAEGRNRDSAPRK